MQIFWKKKWLFQYFSDGVGLVAGRVDEESRCYIGALQLDEKRDTIAAQLSAAMKRKLSIAIALCANSKVD